MHIGHDVKHPLFLSDFNQTWIFLAEFRKILKYQVSWKSVGWKRICSMRTDDQPTGRHDEANSLPPQTQPIPLHRQNKLMAFTTTVAFILINTTHKIDTWVNLRNLYKIPLL